MNTLQHEGVEKWGLEGYHVGVLLDYLWAVGDPQERRSEAAPEQNATYLLPRGRSWRASTRSRRTCPWA